MSERYARYSCTASDRDKCIHRQAQETALLVVFIPEESYIHEIKHHLVGENIETIIIIIIIIIAGFSIIFQVWDVGSL